VVGGVQDFVIDQIMCSYIIDLVSYGPGDPCDTHVATGLLRDSGNHQLCICWAPEHRMHSYIANQENYSNCTNWPAQHKLKLAVTFSHTGRQQFANSDQKSSSLDLAIARYCAGHKYC
jgi:hypothetical protein